MLTSKMTLMAGVCSAKTFKQKQIRSASSAVIGFEGSPDLPRWTIEVRTSIDSAVKRLTFLSASSALEFLTAWLYLKASFVKVVANEAPMKKSPSIKYLRSGGRSWSGEKITLIILENMEQEILAPEKSAAAFKGTNP